MLRDVAAALAETDFSVEGIDSALRAFADRRELKLGQVAHGYPFSGISYRFSVFVVLDCEGSLVPCGFNLYQGFVGLELLNIVKHGGVAAKRS